MPQIILVFSSAATAEYRVAGIPAAARAVQAVGTIAGQDDIRRCAIVADEAWLPSDALLAECRRLAPRLPLAFAARPSAGDILTVCGERFVAALARRPDGGREHVLPALFDARVDARSAAAALATEAGLRLLRRAGCEVLAATGKGGDGIVSRYVNRPISRAISHQLLRFPAVTPFHASLGTAALGLAMTVALVAGGAAGLVAGALLFQAASIFDGVDGEIARATCRSSDAGATLDSVIDACTNLAFVTGVTANLALAGDRSGAVAGGIALISLAAGLLLIGRHASATGAAMNFDVIKLHLRRGGPPSPLTEFLIHLTMRDFFAAISAVMVVAGLTHLLLVAFATIASGWLVVTSVILGIIRRRAGLAAPTYSGGATIKPVR